jgi:hypothetical protein
VVNIGLGGDGPGFSTQPMNLTLCECDGVWRFSCGRGKWLGQGWMTEIDVIYWTMWCVAATSINYLLVATIDCSGCVDGGLA